MKALSVGEILNITGGKLLTGNTGIMVDKVSIDSREANEGMLFVPIKGENVDPHKYIPDVMKYASASFTDRDSVLADIEDEYKERCALILVPGTLRALQELGIYIRNHYDKKVVGVTGSVGKTTTREMITAALSGTVPVFATPKNYNSAIGTPITLSMLEDQPSEVAVLEHGIDRVGEMDEITEMSQPDIAVVTNIGTCHLEKFKTRETIRDEKLKITARMDENGVAFLNGMDKRLYAMKDNLKVKTFFYGLDERLDYHAEDIRFEDGKSCFTYVHGDIRKPMELKMLGSHMILNAVAAMAVTEYLGYDLDKAAKKLQEFQGQRQLVYEIPGGVTFIDDVYNASPDSMKAELNVLSEVDCEGRKIAVLGDMLELGEEEELLHAEVGRAVLASDVDYLVTVGKLSKNISDVVKASNANDIGAVHFETNDEAIGFLKNFFKEGDTVLFKASNGMKFKDIVAALKK
ncbi:MAG: UDP-N-acetylmuramoyl-tripeptide--D-alanyl-D-alanine ligase [Eubacterium sp.]|nr:UDP-N-acetylmuramoyl-tripeptide--D-alanyl-D-alanine ligase [Eubacterium sp.]